VLCVPHGVDPGFRRKQAKRTPEFSVLHLSSSILERKGTDRLIEGWALAKLPDSRLFISVPPGRKEFFQDIASNLDRKSTRLNSSHVKISYAVFCLRKKRCTVH